MGIRTKIFALFLTLSMIALQACVNVATSGAQAVYNHHSLEKTANDEYLTLRGYQAIGVDSDHFKEANISIATMNGSVLLTGQVPQESLKTEAEALVKKATDASDIYNWISVEPNASKWSRASDAWITTKIKTQLIASRDVDATQLKVVTENGSVYLIGILPEVEAEAATDIASHTTGVQKVVKIFSYISVSKKSQKEITGIST